MKKYVLLTALALLLASPSFANAADEGSVTVPAAGISADTVAPEAAAPAAGENTEKAAPEKVKKHKK